MDPDLFPPFAETFVFVDKEFAGAQTLPEMLVLLTLFILLINKHAVVPPLDLIQLIAHRLQKILICSQNGAIERKFNHGLGEIDRIHLTTTVNFFQLGRSDILQQYHHVL
ncbi:Uncharacterised protein [Vibrio cholerae]|nr:Uncharacterised protein [Vibrio cholerae]